MNLFLGSGVSYPGRVTLEGLPGGISTLMDERQQSLRCTWWEVFGSSPNKESQVQNTSKQKKHGSGSNHGSGWSVVVGQWRRELAGRELSLRSVQINGGATLYQHGSELPLIDIRLGLFSD